MLSALIVGVVIICLFLWYRRQTHILTLFERLGVPGPKPHLLYGNMDLLAQGVGGTQLMLKEKYGDIVGFYVGARPFVQVTDIELLKLIQIQEYGVFDSRDRSVHSASFPHHNFADTIMYKIGYRWKTFRSKLTPSVSASKMKYIMKVWNTSFEQYFSKLKEEVLRKESDGLINISDYLRLLTIENFFKSSLSADKRTSVEIHNVDFRSMVRMTEGSFSQGLVRWQCYFPELKGLFHFLRYSSELVRSLPPNMPSAYRTASAFRKIILQRLHQLPGQLQFVDLLQSVLDVRYSVQDPVNFKNKSDFPASDKGVRSMEVPDMQSELMFMATAAFETTSLTVGFTLHLLAHHPEIQERLRQEIVSVLGDRPMQYDDLHQLPYLEQVINEALRLYPPTITFINRVNNRDFTYKDITFPRGTTFSVPIWALHRSPDFWQDPSKFDPDRFSLERRGDINPLVYQPFGRGQRSCIGERYGLNLSRAITCSFLRSFRVELSPNRPEETPAIQDYLLIIKPKNGIEVRLVPLDS